MNETPDIQVAELDKDAELIDKLVVDIAKVEDQAILKRQIAASNYSVERQRLTEQINRIQNQMAKKGLTPRKRKQLERRLTKLMHGGRRPLK